jgi:hypothetical protein
MGPHQAPGFKPNGVQVETPGVPMACQIGSAVGHVAQPYTYLGQGFMSLD